MEFLVGVVIVLNLVGVIWLGIAIDHWFLTLVGYIIALAVIGGINEDAFVIVMIAVAGITLICIIGVIISAIKDNKREEDERKRIEIENKKNSDLFMALREKDSQTARNLIEDGAYVDYVEVDNQRKKSVLQLAIENNDKEMVSFLIEKGADVNLIIDGKTPLDYAKDEETISLLRSHGAKTKGELDEYNKIKAEEKFSEAMEYYVKGNYSMACFYLEEAVNLGHIEAHHYLGNIYGSGLGGAKDIDKAIKLFEVAANAGIIDAQANLGALYFQKGRNISYENAGAKVMAWGDGYRWSKQAADQGSTDAMFNLGIHNIETEYFDEAGKWLEKAARQGHSQALDVLKDLCRKGLYYVNL